MRASAIAMLIFELIFITFLVYDPIGLFPDEDGIAKIEHKLANQEITPTQAKAEKIMYFAMFWIVAAIAKLFLGFSSCVWSGAFAIPMFIYGFRLNEAGAGSAFIWAFICFIFIGGFMFGAVKGVFDGLEA